MVVIPVCLISGTGSITVNGESQMIPSSFETEKPACQSMVFELQTDVKELHVSAKGENNSICVIKDIELWQ